MHYTGPLVCTTHAQEWSTHGERFRRGNVANIAREMRGTCDERNSPLPNTLPNDPNTPNVFKHRVQTSPYTQRPTKRIMLPEACQMLLVAWVNHVDQVNYVDLETVPHPLHAMAIPRQDPTRPPRCLLSILLNAEVIRVDAEWRISRSPFSLPSRVRLGGPASCRQRLHAHVLQPACCVAHAVHSGTLGVLPRDWQGLCRGQPELDSHEAVVARSIPFLPGWSTNVAASEWIAAVGDDLGLAGAKLLRAVFTIEHDHEDAAMAEHRLCVGVIAPQSKHAASVDPIAFTACCAQRCDAKNQLVGVRRVQFLHALRKRERAQAPWMSK